MSKKGFALIEILIVVVVLGFLVGGGWYVSRLQSEQTTITTGINAVQQAKQVTQQMNQRGEQEQNLLDQAAGTGLAPTTPAATTTSSSTKMHTTK